MTPEQPKQPPPKPVSVQKPKRAADYQPPSYSPPSHSVSFNSDVELINNNSSYSQFASPPRRAAEYEPPTAFIDNMERPMKPSTPAYKTSSGPSGVKMNSVLEDLWRV